MVESLGTAGLDFAEEVAVVSFRQPREAKDALAKYKGVVDPAYMYGSVYLQHRAAFRHGVSLVGPSSYTDFSCVFVDGI